MRVGFCFTKDDYFSMLPTAVGAMDIGGFNTALTCACHMLLRPYYTGNPSPQWLANTILLMDAKVKGGAAANSNVYYVVGNEPNLPEVEHWQGGLDAYADFFKAVRSLLPPSIKLAWAGMSPGKPGFLDWYARAKAHGPDAVAAHVYGQSLSSLKDLTSSICQAVAPLPVIIGECNFGPGANVVVDRNLWATSVWEPFLTWVATQAQILFTLYFAWTWKADTPIATPVDAQGTQIYTVTLKKALEGTLNVTPNAPSKVQLTQAHGPKRTETRNIFIHSTRSGSTTNTLQQEYLGTISYFMDPAGDSAHGVLGPGEWCRMVDDDYEAEHATENNHWALGIEIAQPLPSTKYTDFMYKVAADIVGKWCDKYNIPKVRVFSQTERGIIGHEDSEQGKRYGKSDPGVMWDWVRFMNLVTGGTVPYDPGPDRDAAYAILQQHQQGLVSIQPNITRLRTNGWLQIAEALTQAANAASDAMEGGKRAIVISKGEK